MISKCSVGIKHILLLPENRIYEEMKGTLQSMTLAFNMVNVIMSVIQKLGTFWHKGMKVVF